MKRRALATGLLVCAAVAVCFFVWRGTPDLLTPAAPEVAARSVAKEQSRPETLSTPIEPERTALERGHAVKVTPRVERRHVIRGRVVGLTPGDRIDAQIRAWIEFGGHRWEARAGVESYGFFMLPCDGALDDVLNGLGKAGGLVLVVQAEHPDYESYVSRIPVRSIEWLEQPDGTHVLDMGALELRLHATVSGQVIVLGGDCRGPVEVALFTLDAGEPDRRPGETVRCNADGTFVVKAMNVGSGLLVALCEGHRPASQIIELDHSDDLFVTLVLEQGASIRGTASNGERPMPRDTAVLATFLEGEEAAQMRIRQTDLAFIRGRAERYRITTAITEGGHFRLDGLAPGVHRLIVTGMPGNRPSWYSAAVDRVDVHAPAAGIELEVGLATLRFELTGAGPGVADDHPETVRIVLRKAEGMGFMGRSFNEKGVFTVMVDPWSEYTLRASLDQTLDSRMFVSGSRSFRGFHFTGNDPPPSGSVGDTFVRAPGPGESKTIAVSWPSPPLPSGED